MALHYSISGRPPPLREFGALLNATLDVIRAQPATRFVLSETSPQHFATDDGGFPGAFTGSSCRPRASNWSRHFSNALARPPMRRAGVPILYTERAAISRWDAHVVHTFRRDYYGAQNEIVDCTHWCSPGVPDVWALQLANMLLHLHRGASDPTDGVSGPAVREEESKYKAAA